MCRMSDSESDGRADRPLVVYFEELFLERVMRRRADSSNVLFTCVQFLGWFFKRFLSFLVPSRCAAGELGSNFASLYRFSSLFKGELMVETVTELISVKKY